MALQQISEDEGTVTFSSVVNLQRNFFREASIWLCYTLELTAYFPPDFDVINVSEPIIVYSFGF